MFIEEIERLERKDAFLQKAKKRYGELFDYSQTQYINSTSKVIIICKTHGPYAQTPAKHLVHKYGCPICARQGWGKERRVSKELFLKQVLVLYKDRYGYEQTAIGRYDCRLKIFCKKHNQYFEQMQHLHLSGRLSCAKCIKEYQFATKAEVKKVLFVKNFCDKFGNSFDFSQLAYINNTTPVAIKCLKHNQIFMQVPRNILRYDVCSCKFCKKEKRLKT